MGSDGLRSPIAEIERLEDRPRLRGLGGGEPARELGRLLLTTAARRGCGDGVRVDLHGAVMHRELGVFQTR